MNNATGISQEGIRVALQVKEDYRLQRPICLPGDDARILVPENLINSQLDLQGFEDPLPLAVVATRDPESPMALAAITRMSPLAPRKRLVAGVFQVVGEVTRHPVVRECVNLITETAFDPRAIGKIRHHAEVFILRTRQQFTLALRENLRALVDGSIAPRQFVQQFFELTEAGNLRQDIRKRLVVSLLLSETVRPSIKFLMLENFHRLPRPVRIAIIGAVMRAEPTRHTEIIKEELRWMVSQEQPALSSR